MSRTSPPTETPLRAVGLRIDAGGDDDLLGLPPGYVRARVLAHKLVVLRGFRSMSQDEFLAFARAFDPAGVRLHEWPTGPVMEVKIDPQAVNFLFTNERVPLHVDGMYGGEPSYLVFQCIAAPRGGGATLFVDAAKVWDLADDEHRRIWENTSVTYSMEKKAHFGGVITVPLVNRHKVTQKQTLRYCEPVATKLNPLTVTVEGLSDQRFAELVDDLRARIYDDRVCEAHVWQDGDVVIADNHALLHGRTAIEGGGRHLRRVQII